MAFSLCARELDDRVSEDAHAEHELRKVHVFACLVRQLFFARKEGAEGDGLLHAAGIGTAADSDCVRVVAGQLAVNLEQ